jgi:hypothetical protein
VELSALRTVPVRDDSTSSGRAWAVLNGKKESLIIRKAKMKKMLRRAGMILNASSALSWSKSSFIGKWTGLRGSANPLLLCGLVAGISMAGSSANGQDTNRPPADNATMTNAAASSAAAATNTMANSSPSQRLLLSDRGRFGIGAMVGEPTGLSMKYWLSEKNAVDLGAAWSFEDHGSFQLQSDFLTHKFDIFPVDYGELPLYFGIGGRVKFPDHGETRAGVRVPVGVSYFFPDVPIELFAEVAPIMDVTPSTHFCVNGGIGVRYYFK